MQNGVAPFCEGVAHLMAARFGVTVREAVKRINYLWVHSFLGQDDVRYHRMQPEWAEHIFAWYEERLANGTADLPRDVIVSRLYELEREYWERNRKGD
jgi:hypothetical protein